MGLSLLILPSLLGIDSIVRFVLDTKLFNFIAKASYCTYLIHLVVLTFIMTIRKIDFYYDLTSVFGYYTFYAVVSIFLGFILTILVEIPFAKLQKMLLTYLFNKMAGKKT